MAGTFERFGSEFVVNTTSLGNQLQSAIAKLGDGRFIVTWTDTSGLSNEGDTGDIRAQIFNADGSKSGAEFLVNDMMMGRQSSSSVTTLADGCFVVTWLNNGEAVNGVGINICAQMFNADGTKSGHEFEIGTATSWNQSDNAITALSNGGFVVTWTGSSGAGSDGSGSGVRGQIFDAEGQKVGNGFIVNTITTSNQKQGKISALDDGRFVVTWTDGSGIVSGDRTGWDIAGQVFNADGTKSGSAFLVNSATLSYQVDSDVTTLSDGRFVVSWTDASGTGGDTSSVAVRAQIFNIDGTKSGQEFLVNTITQCTQNESSIVALSDGRFVVVWTDFSCTLGDPDRGSINAQVFGPDGSKSGAEFRVNIFVKGAQRLSKVEALNDGRFVVTWDDSSELKSDGTGIIIRSQIFDPKNYSGDEADETVIGGSLNDSIAGGNGADCITGGVGNDSLDGGSGDDIASYKITSTTASWTRNSNGTWTVSTAVEGIDILTNIELLQFTDRTVVLRNNVAKVDFSNDGYSDIVMWNTKTNELGVRLVSANGDGSQWISFGTVDQNWQVVGTGQFNADQTLDLLFRNSNTGEVVQWILEKNGSIVQSTSYGFVSSDWQIAGTNDFNGDGITDILWRNSETGQVAQWMMESNGTVSAYTTQGLVAADWKIADTADFNNDSVADILWRNMSSGEVAQWIMTKDGTIETARILNIVSDDWQIAGANDFNNDGIADILWRNSSSGEVAEWIMSLDGAISTVYIQESAPADWQIAGTGDYNSDGIADILWRNTASGEVGQWIMKQDGTGYDWKSQGVTTTDWQIRQV